MAWYSIYHKTTHLIAAQTIVYKYSCLSLSQVDVTLTSDQAFFGGFFFSLHVREGPSCNNCFVGIEFPHFVGERGVDFDGGFSSSNRSF